MNDSFAPRFEPTRAAAQARVAAVRPAAYARTRNALDGAVSQLSPYITHGFVSFVDMLAGVASRRARDVQHKFVLAKVKPRFARAGLGRRPAGRQRGACMVTEAAKENVNEALQIGRAHV